MFDHSPEVTIFNKYMLNTLLFVFFDQKFMILRFQKKPYFLFSGPAHLHMRFPQIGHSELAYQTETERL